MTIINPKDMTNIMEGLERDVQRAVSYKRRKAQLNSLIHDLYKGKIPNSVTHYVERDYEE